MTTGNWRGHRAPDLDAFEAIAREVYDGLPQEFRALTENLVIRVAEFPTDEVVEQMKLESPFDLLGLFHGIGLPHGGAVAMTGQMPNQIWLYRRPILDYWSEHDESLGDIIAHVLIHEIGHHFGLSDEDIDAIEASAD
jgi:predicted Zn-dependent protease with MMP-like domain